MNEIALSVILKSNETNIISVEDYYSRKIKASRERYISPTAEDLDSL